MQPTRVSCTVSDQSRNTTEGVLTSEKFILLESMVWEKQTGSCLPVCGVEGTAALVNSVQVPQRLRQLLLLDALHRRVPWSCATHKPP